MNECDFDRIFVKYYSSLCVFAFRYTRDNQVAEDLVQDVFCRLIEDSEKIRNPDSIRSFLYQSVRNNALNYLKNMDNRHVGLEADMYEEGLNACIDAFVTNGEDTEYDYRILARTIRSVISSMPEKQKQVFIMSRKKHLANKDIAVALNISIKTVEKHITKSLSVIRKKLTDEKLITLLILFLLSHK